MPLSLTQNICIVDSQIHSEDCSRIHLAAIMLKRQNERPLSVDQSGQVVPEGFVDRLGREHGRSFDKLNIGHGRLLGYAKGTGGHHPPCARILWILV